MTGIGLPFEGTLEKPRMPLEGIELPESFAVEELLAERADGRFAGDDRRTRPALSRFRTIRFALFFGALAFAAIWIERSRRGRKVEPFALVAAVSAVSFGAWFVHAGLAWAEATSSPTPYLRIPDYALRTRDAAPWVMALAFAALVRVAWTRRDGLGLALVSIGLPFHAWVLVEIAHFAPGFLTAPRGTVEVALPTLNERQVTGHYPSEVVRLQIAGEGPRARLTIDFAPRTFDFDPPEYSGSLEGDWRAPLAKALDRYGTSPVRRSRWAEPPEDPSRYLTVQLRADRDLTWIRLEPVVLALDELGVDVVTILGEGVGMPGARARTWALFPDEPEEHTVTLELLLRDGEVVLRTPTTEYPSLRELMESKELLVPLRSRPRRDGTARPVRYTDEERPVLLRPGSDVPFQLVAQLLGELSAPAIDTRAR